MVLRNIIMTVVRVGADVLMTSDVKQTAAIFRRNVRHIRNWLEEANASISKALENGKPKKPKEDKH